jgi:CRP/FNR family cyclic AMP-dependent transcriptional regulator
VFNPNAAESLGRDRARRFRDGNHAARAEKGVATALAYVPLFSLCSKRELRQIAKCAKTKEVRAGTTLMAEGEQGDTMYVLLSGHAAVQKGGRRIAQVERGGVLGELAVLAKTPRNATVTTTTDAEIAVIGRRDVFKLIEDAPGFSRKLLEALAERVRELDKKIVC